MFIHIDIFTPLAFGDIPFEPFWFVFFELLSIGMVINVVLGAFNLIPFPPLDGSWILKALLPKKAALIFAKFQSFGFIFLLLAVQFHLLEFFLYPITSRSAVRSKDGTILYSYPQGARFGCLTDNFVLLIREDFAETTDGELLFLEKHTGRIKKSYPGKAYFIIIKAAEDPQHIYLIANYYLDKQAAVKVTSDILILNKQTLELQEIKIGKNIPMYQIKIFPRDSLIFIPTYQHVGAYSIPEQVEQLQNQSN